MDRIKKAISRFYHAHPTHLVIFSLHECLPISHGLFVLSLLLGPTVELATIKIAGNKARHQSAFKKRIEVPAKSMTNNQIRLLMQSKERGKSLALSAAQTGFSERSTYNVASRSYETANRKRSWRTRSDPYEDVWEKGIVPLLESSANLEARCPRRRRSQEATVCG